MELKGGCACGAVRFALLRDPLIVNACHCRDCQRLSGGAFVVNAWIERTEVDLRQGDLAVAELVGGSGAPHRVHRCAACGTQVWSRYGESSDTLFVRVGTLDDPSALPPDAHIYTRSKQPWLQLPDDGTVHESSYSLRSVWTPEAIARLKAVRL